MKGVEYLLHTHMDIHCCCHDQNSKVAKFCRVVNNVNKRLILPCFLRRQATTLFNVLGLTRSILRPERGRG